MHIVRTTLNLPLSLIRKAQKYLSAKTKTEAIVRSLEDIVKRHDTLKLARSVVGQVPVDLSFQTLKNLRKSRL